jgi:hypothetical protein
MTSARLLVAAACFALALGLPFGRTAGTVEVRGMALAQPILVVEPGTTGYGPNGEVLAIPGRLRLQYVPLFLPGWSAPASAAALGRTVTARVPLVLLLAAALLAWRRRSPVLARRAALAGGVALAATGILAAVPSTGAVVAIFGVALLGTIDAPRRRVRSAIRSIGDAAAIGFGP